MGLEPPQDKFEMPPFIVPPMPDQLVAALKRSYSPNGASPVTPLAPPATPFGPPPPPTGTAAMTPGAAPTSMAAPPIRMGAGGVNLAPKNPPGVPASGIPAASLSATAATASPSMKLPSVTDDPNVARGSNGPAQSGAGRWDNPRDNANSLVDYSRGMGEMPKQQDLGSYLNPALNQYKSDLSGFQQADEGHRVDPSTVKPHLWDRLLGGVVGGLSGNMQTGKDVTHRRLIEAEKQRSVALAPWTQRLEMDKAGVPLAESAATTAYHQGELGLKEAAENRERFSAIKSAEAKEELNTLREQWNNERDKNSQERNASYLQHITDLAAKYKDDHALQLELEHLKERVEDFKEQKEAKGKDHTAQVLATEKTKENAITAAEDKYRKALKQLDETQTPGTDEYKQARAAIEDEHTNDLQRSENAYEVKGTELGGNIPHQDVASWRKGSQTTPPPASASAAATPAAKPQPAAAEEAPTKAGPANEKPVRTAGQGKIGFYKSTGQWMLVPPNSGGN
jgi:hypothetical protein